MQVYHAFIFSIWPPVAVNIVYFLVHVIDGLGGGGCRNIRGIVHYDFVLV